MEHINKNLGFILLIILSLVYLVFSVELGINFEFSIGKFFSYYIWFSIIYFILKYKNVENRINYSSIIPIVVIIFQFTVLYDKHNENKKIELFYKGLSKIERKWDTKNSLDLSKREEYKKEIIKYFDDYSNTRNFSEKNINFLSNLKKLRLDKINLEEEFIKNYNQISDIWNKPTIQSKKIINDYISSIENLIKFYRESNISTKESSDGEINFMKYKEHGERIKKIINLNLDFQNKTLSSDDYNLKLKKYIKSLEDFEENW